MPNLQRTCTGAYSTNLFVKITAKFHHGLNTVPELLAGLGHGFPREVGHHLCDVDHQRGGSVVRGFVNIPPQMLLKSRKLQLVERQYGHWHAPWTWTCTMAMDMQHGHGHTPWSWISRIDMEMQHGDGHAAWKWTCIMDMDMQHGHGHGAGTWTCSMNADMQQGYGHAIWAWTWLCSMDIDMQHGLHVGHHSALLSGSW